MYVQSRPLFALDWLKSPFSLFGRSRRRKKAGPLMTCRISPSITLHAARRLAQRNLDPSDVSYVASHGRVHHAAHALFIHLGRRDIPAEDFKDDRFRRLEGTVLVLDPGDGSVLATAYRNRRSGSRNIKRKPK
jgi:hypothetical protein